MTAYSEEWKQDAVRLAIAASRNGEQARARRWLGRLLTRVNDSLPDEWHREMYDRLERAMEALETPE